MPDGQRMQFDKETFMGADTETRWSMSFDMWATLIEQTQHQASFCHGRREACEAKYAQKGDQKRANLYALLGGFGGGLVFWATLVTFSINL